MHIGFGKALNKFEIRNSKLGFNCCLGFRIWFLVLLICISSNTPTPAIAADGLYEKIRNMTRKEALIDEKGMPGFEAVVAHFASQIIQLEDGSVNAVETSDALRSDKWMDLCSKKDHRGAMNYGSCALLVQNLTDLGRHEEEIRSLGRELQLIAAGYELPIDNHPDLPSSLSSQTESIRTLWAAGSASAGDTDRPPIRVIPVPLGLNAEFQALAQSLKDLISTDDAGDDREQYIAAVWRYRYGVRYVKGERPQNQLGTERQYLFHRWTTVEDALLAIRDRLPGMPSSQKPLTPPFKQGEIVFFSMDNYADIDPLFSEIRMWAYHEGGALTQNQQQALDGDIGLQWVFPTEPALPSILSHAFYDPIPGGSYPPPPTDGTGLCSSPIGRLGYLCRPIDGQSDACADNRNNQQNKKGNPQNGQGTITLARCQGNQTSLTQAGPNVCRDVLWRADSYEQAPAACKNCSVQISCQQSCNGSIFGNTAPKKSTGDIPVCIGTGIGRYATYTAIYELTHTQQLCQLPPNTPLRTSSSCCSIELEAHRASCSAMAIDGLFKGTDITVKQCSTFLATKSCRDNNFGSATCGTEAYSDQAAQRVIDTARNTLNQLPPLANPASFCDTTIKQPGNRDPRVQALLDGTLDVCNPQCRTMYRNTIGNNLCYSGQCIEESLEQHRITPGRNTFGVQDEAFPWDACKASDPQLSLIVTPPAQQQSALPAYRPTLLIRNLDIAFCQTNGLPPHVPAFLCEVAPGNRLGFSTESIVEESLRQRTEQQQFIDPASGFEDLSEGFATRLGSSLYAETLRQTGRTLGDLIGMAADLLGELPEIAFTDQMCPLNSTGDGTLRCPAP